MNLLGIANVEMFSPFCDLFIVDNSVLLDKSFQTAK